MLVTFNKGRCQGGQDEQKDEHIIITTTIMSEEHPQRTRRSPG